MSLSSVGPAFKQQKLRASQDLVAEREAEATQEGQQWPPQLARQRFSEAPSDCGSGGKDWLPRRVFQFLEGPGSGRRKENMSWWDWLG